MHLKLIKNTEIRWGDKRKARDYLRIGIDELTMSTKVVADLSWA